MNDGVTSPTTAAPGCPACHDGQLFASSFSMAFQPIVDIERGVTFAYEALARGSNGESANSILSQVTQENRYAFDHQCRVKAIDAAARAGILDTPARLSINFLPKAVFSAAACIHITLRAARATAFPTDRLIFEFTENEEMTNLNHVERIIATYRQMGFGTAIDDFGSGYAGLTLLARFQTDFIKLDMDLIRGLESSSRRRMIVDGVVKMCAALGVTVIAEGIETRGELDALREIGVRYIQGFYFAKPAFERLPPIAIDVPEGLGVVSR